MPVRYLTELPVQAIGFTIMVAALHVAQFVRAARERELPALPPLPGAAARPLLTPPSH